MNTNSELNIKLFFRRAFTAALLSAAILPATASESTAVANDTLQPRTYMGETVMAEPDIYKPEVAPWLKQIRVNGAIQTEFHVPVKDDLTEKEPYTDKKLLNNTYFDLTISAPYISIGGRFEFAKWPLPAFYKTKEYAGWGVPYLWATGKYKWFQITGGDYYEQFGSGLILRAYTDRNMGIDSSIRGGRIKVNPFNGMYITGLVGKQRYYWEHNPALIWGADAEWAFDETFSKAFSSPYGLSLGFSYVGTHQGQTNYDFTQDGGIYKLYFPETVAAYDYRIKARLHDFSILAEGAYKTQDPCKYNNYTYGNGHAEMLSVSYAAKGTSAFIQAKRSQDMKFTSDRMQNDEQGNGNINHLPAFTNTQTYTLASIYAYGTQADGEWAFQAEFGHLFKKGTPLGGKYGTNLKVSGSYISGLAGQPPHILAKPLAGTDGYKPAYWKIGDLYYADANIEIKKKVLKNLQFTLFYLYQKFNIQVLQGEGNVGQMVTANTFVLEGQWKMAKKTQLRWELQYLTSTKPGVFEEDGTKHAEWDNGGDWMAALLELSIAPHWMVTLTDAYNHGNPVKKENYYKAMVTYSYKANRFSVSYGRTRAGWDCSGGVCREVPATNGLSFTYNYTF